MTGIIGVGNMAGAILNGILGSGIRTPESIMVYDVLPEKLEPFTCKGCAAASSERDLVKQCSTVILAIKPQGFAALLEEIKDVLDESKLVISIAAGISIDFINQAVGKTLPVIRVLPNTPMLYGDGVSALAYRSPVTEEQAAFADSIFSSCGRVYRVEEDDINRTIPVHSSSPAYVFLMIKAMADNAEKHGLDRAMALEMITGTFTGAAKMVEQSGLSCEELIQMVASKGGTTEASLRSFAQDDFSAAIDRAMDACIARAYELGKKD